MFSRRISSADCSTGLAVFLTVTVAVVAVNLLSIVLFVKNSNLRTRAMYLVINLTVADMFVGGIAIFDVVFQFLLYGCESENILQSFFKREWQAGSFTTINMWLPLTSVTAIVVISLDRMHATFRPFRHLNIKKWAYGVTIACVWILTAMLSTPFPLMILYGNWSQQQWQLVFPLYVWLSYCCLCLIVICVSYTSIALKVWCGTRPPSRGAAIRQRKLTVTLFITTLVSLLLLLPYVIYIFVSLSVIPSLVTFFRLLLSLTLIYHTNSLVNPIIYTIRILEFRRALLKLFKRRQRQNAAIALEGR